MKTVRKTLILAACAMLLVCATVVGTLAYLTSTDSVSNSFTVGNVSITLDEAKVGENGKEIVGEGAERVQTNDYKLLPGKEYDKDPTIHVGDASENCYVFVKVENNVSAVEDQTTGKSIASQMTALGWKQIEETNVYYKEAAVVAGEDVVVFNNFTVSSTANNEALTAVADKTIVVTAYAIQAEGFTSATDAWAKAGAEAQG